jgi:hypothetical protein
VAEDVLPQIEKFLESPEEKRLRRVRAGVVTAAIGVGATLLIFLLSLGSHDLVPFMALGVITFLIGLGMVINGLAFTVPNKKLATAGETAPSPNELETRSPNPVPLPLPSPTTNELLTAQPSVTEHTTHQLRTNQK